MPTAAKFVAALIFAAVGYFAAQAYIPSLPEGTQTRGFREICAFIGLLCGWIVMGRRVGKPYSEAIGSGILTSVIIVFWALLLFSVYEMIQLSIKMRYDGPMDAVLGVFELMLEYGMALPRQGVLLALGVGGIVGGIAAEVANRLWR